MSICFETTPTPQPRRLKTPSRISGNRTNCMNDVSLSLIFLGNFFEHTSDLRYTSTSYCLLHEAILSHPSAPMPFAFFLSFFLLPSVWSWFSFLQAYLLFPQVGFWASERHYNEEFFQHILASINRGLYLFYHCYFIWLHLFYLDVYKGIFAYTHQAKD